MGTKPQTLAYALTDSPVGLAAWILEKFRTWSDCKGDLDAHFSRDVLLTNIMLYWITGAIGSSFWPYYARLHEPWIVPPGHKVMVPTGKSGGADLRQYHAMDSHAVGRPLRGTRGPAATRCRN